MRIGFLASLVRRQRYGLVDLSKRDRRLEVSFVRIVAIQTELPSDSYWHETVVQRPQSE